MRIVRRPAAAGTDEEGYLWLGPEGVEEGSGEGIRKKKKKEGIMGQVKLWPFKTMPWDCPTQPCRLIQMIIK